MLKDSNYLNTEASDTQVCFIIFTTLIFQMVLATKYQRTQKFAILLQSRRDKNNDISSGYSLEKRSFSVIEIML